MTFEEILDHALAMLQRRGRLTYSTLKRQFQLDEDALNDLKAELLYAHPEVRDDAGRNPRHHFVDTSADASRPCSVIVNPAISACRLLYCGAHCDVYPTWLLAILGFIRHGRLHSADM